MASLILLGPNFFFVSRPTPLVIKHDMCILINVLKYVLTYWPCPRRATSPTFARKISSDRRGSIVASGMASPKKFAKVKNLLDEKSYIDTLHQKVISVSVPRFLLAGGMRAVGFDWLGLIWAQYFERFDWMIIVCILLPCKSRLVV